MRRAAVLALAALVALTGSAGCSDDGSTDLGAGDVDASATEPAPGGEDPFDGRTFVSQVGVDGLVADTALRLTFTDGRMALTAGCNQMSGAYAIEDDTLVVDTLAGTQMGCDPALMEQDARLAGVFADPVAWVLDGATLALTAGDRTFTLADEAASAPAPELVGPTWTLDTLLAGETASSVPEGVTATITFADDGTYAVEAGCNTGSGTYAEAGDATYVVEPPGLTRRRCDEEAMEVESAVVTVLDGEVELLVEGDRLTITTADDGARGLGLTAG